MDNKRICQDIHVSMVVTNLYLFWVSKALLFICICKTILTAMLWFLILKVVDFLFLIQKKILVSTCFFHKRLNSLWATGKVSKVRKLPFFQCRAYFNQFLRFSTGPILVTLVNILPPMAKNQQLCRKWMENPQNEPHNRI